MDSWEGGPGAFFLSSLWCLWCLLVSLSSLLSVGVPQGPVRGPGLLLCKSTFQGTFGHILHGVRRLGVLRVTPGSLGVLSPSWTASVGPSDLVPSLSSVRPRTVFSLRLPVSRASPLAEERKRSAGRWPN